MAEDTPETASGSDDSTAASGDGQAGASETERAGGAGDGDNATGAEGAMSEDEDATAPEGGDAAASEDRDTTTSESGDAAASTTTPNTDVPPDVATYERFTKMDGAQYERVNDFLRERTYITAREWAIARLCADFRTETGVEMTKIGENLPHLVPFMTDTYTPQAVNQARSAFEEKVRQAGATFLYGAMSDLLTADELDDVMYEATEVAKFLLEVEGVDMTVEEELDAEERISSVMREVRTASDELRHEGVECPHCGETFDPENPEAHVD